MASPVAGSERVFKTAWFSKAARKAHIEDTELCKAVRQVMLGQADNLGGGVFKKRLARNLYRSIILANSGRHWIYVYLFAKQDRANIDDDELAAFRSLAGLYARKSDVDISREIYMGELGEICNGEERQI
jgi:hypothetical protein